MKRVAILQSNYIPWKGYFDLINSVDEFVIYDSVQYTRRDWRNRNLIKTARGARWLTIPVYAKGKFDQLIRETVVADSNWAEKHLKVFRHEYSKAPHYRTYIDVFEGIFERASKLQYLSDINRLFIDEINRLLSIKTSIKNSRDFELQVGSTEKLVSISRDCGADVYVSGPAAKVYLEEHKFEKQGIGVEWYHYSDYPEYKQLHTPFEHRVTILDLLFNTGEDAPKYMNSFVVSRGSLQGS